MNIRHIVLLSLIALVTSSCVPQDKAIRTATLVPTLTFAPVLPNPTLTTVSPEFARLPDPENLTTWVDNYVHEYHGSITFNDTDIGTNQYPTAKLTTNSTLSYIPLAKCEKGIYFYQNRTYSTADDVSQVDKWYRQHGWQDFIIKGHALGLYIYTGPIKTPIDVQTMQRVYYSTEAELTIINFDLQIFACPEN